MSRNIGDLRRIVPFSPSGKPRLANSMSTEKADAIVLRLADFSESSRVVTLFTREFGAVSALAKGAKRLRSSFEAALDLLAVCRVVFIRKSGTGLDLLTEAQLRQRFRPPAGTLNSLYCGYYVAELLSALTEPYDPHPQLFDDTVATLNRFAAETDPKRSLLHFELTLLREIGHLPNFDECAVCSRAIKFDEPGRYWVSQGGLICSNCGREEWQNTSIQPGTIAVLRRLSQSPGEALERLQITPQQYQQARRVLTATFSQLMDRRPKMAQYLKF